MAVSGSLQLSLEFGICSDHHLDGIPQSSRTRARLRLLGSDFSSSLYSWSTNLSRKIRRRVCTIDSRNRQFKCHCILNSTPSLGTTCIKNAALTLSRSISHFQGNSVLIKLASSIGIVIFAIWGLVPFVRKARSILLRKIDNNSWKKSRTYYVTTSYVQPLLLWAGAIFNCRALDQIILPSQSSLLVKQRVIHFARSLSTVLAFAHCLSSVVRESQKFFMEANDQIDNRNMGFQFAGRAAYTAVWIAAVSLFMELLGFSTQKLVTAGGLGTVLLTLAGREILTNFLSSVMIHTTRPFVVNEWIQAKIGGYEVSGTVEHVGWWSPTIIRGDDREAVHIPNHKFTVNIIRNLSQKSHWRIKTHLAISHLDVGKVNNIVADMRKVLAKNPQVEQQKLHRRVFLDYINPENQALSIMVSCFVKTSRFEEYLCVKEAVLLDLLRVIAHHRARLATPIRTVQKVYSDADVDSVYTRGATSNRPLLLIEPSYKINGEDKPKTQTQTQTRSDNATTKSNDSSNSQQKTTKTSLEENIVLGVALEGSKRTLPIEEEDVTSNTEYTKELAALCSGNGTKATTKGKADATAKRTNGNGDQPDGQD